MSQSFYDWLVERVWKDFPDVFHDDAINKLNMLQLAQYVSEFLENHR